jgi:hypothetical protein
MGSKAMRVAVLFRAQERNVAGYLIHHLAQVWREGGLEVVYL